MCLNTRSLLWCCEGKIDYFLISWFSVFLSLLFCQFFWYLCTSEFFCSFIIANRENLKFFFCKKKENLSCVSKKQVLSFFLNSFSRSPLQSNPPPQEQKLYEKSSKKFENKEKNIEIQLLTVFLWSLSENNFRLLYITIWILYSIFVWRRLLCGLDARARRLLFINKQKRTHA